MPAAPLDHAQKLFEFVNALWPKDRHYSYTGCHLPACKAFSALHPHLGPGEAVPLTAFQAVLEMLPRILNKYPLGCDCAGSDGDGGAEPHVKKSFLDLWAELGRSPEQSLYDPSGRLWMLMVYRLSFS